MISDRVGKIGTIIYLGGVKVNKQFIMNMEPGDELDLLVGEKVLGLSAEVDKDGVHRPVKSFSKDPSTLWAIIDSMVKRDYQYNISNSNRKHTCVFDSISTYKRYIIHANTPMEAICKASLLAVVEEERMNM